MYHIVFEMRSRRQHSRRCMCNVYVFCYWILHVTQKIDVWIIRMPAPSLLLMTPFAKCWTEYILSIKMLLLVCLCVGGLSCSLCHFFVALMLLLFQYKHNFYQFYLNEMWKRTYKIQILPKWTLSQTLTRVHIMHAWNNYYLTLLI